MCAREPVHNVVLGYSDSQIRLLLSGARTKSEVEQIPPSTFASSRAQAGRARLGRDGVALAALPRSAGVRAEVWARAGHSRPLRACLRAIDEGSPNKSQSR